MSDSDNEAFEAEQAKRLAKEKRLEELEEAKKLAEDPDGREQVREDFKKRHEQSKKQERQLKNGENSDDDEAKEDEAMEGDESDHDDENSDPPEGESDPESAQSSDKEDHEEKSRRKVAQKFMDIDAELSDEDSKEFIKGLKAKHGKNWKKYIDDDDVNKATASDNEFIDDEIRYEPDFEKELKKKRRKAGVSSPEPPPKKDKGSKRKRILSDDEEEGEEEKKEEKPKKSTQSEVFETDDASIENMASMEKENPSSKKPAKFHESKDIAKDTQDRKNKSVDPASLVYSPRKPKPEKKSTNSPAHGSSKKKPKPKGDKPIYETGFVFQNGSSAYQVTHRASDFPMVKGNSGARVVDNNCHDITLLSTCMKMDTLDDGTYKRTGQFELFFINKETKPKKLQPAGATAMWEAFSENHPEKAKKLVLLACDCENIADKSRLLIPPNVWKKVTKECHKDKSEWKWEPRAPKSKAAAADPILPSPPSLASQSSFVARIEKSATPPNSGKKPPAAAPSSGTNKSSANPAKKAKTASENGTHDIAKMLQRTSTSKPAAAAAASSAMDDDPFANIFASMGQPKKLDMFEKNRSSMIDLVVGAVKALQEQHPNKDMLRKKYSEIGAATDNEVKGVERSGKEKVILMQNLLGYTNGQQMHPLWAVLFFLPFISEEAAVATRALLFDR